MRLGPVGVGELAGGSERLKQRDRQPRDLVRLRVRAVPDQRPGEQRQRLGLPRRVTRIRPERDRLAVGLDRLGQPIEHGAFARVFGEGSCPVCVVPPVGKAQDTPVMRGRLAMRAERRGGTSGCGPIEDDVRRRPRALRIMGKPCRKALLYEACLNSRRQHLPADRPAPQGIDGLEHGIAHQFVPESEAMAHILENGEGEAVRKPLTSRSGDRLKQIVLHPRTHDRGEVEEPAPLDPEPRDAPEHRIAHRRRHLGDWAGDHFCYEERIAPGGPQEAVNVDHPAAGQRRHGLPTEARKLHPRHVPRRGEIAEQETETIVPLDLVIAEGGDHQDPHPVEPPAEIFHEVDRRIVSPMDVLEYQDRRFRQPGQYFENPDEFGGRAASLVELLRQVTAKFPQDVIERPQRRRCQKRIAVAPKDADGSSVDSHEVLDEGRLPDAGLAADHHELPQSSAGPFECCFQHEEITLPLEEADHIRLRLDRLRISAGRRYSSGAG